MNAIQFLAPLEPEKSNDPETLGLSGAIYKRLWDQSKDEATLNKAIQFYQKGFDLRGDYYNGENAANCLEIRSKLQAEANEALFDRMSSRKIREAVIDRLIVDIADESFSERSDQLWVYATLANCFFGLGDKEAGDKYEALFIEEKPADWQKETYFDGKSRVIGFLNQTTG